MTTSGPPGDGRKPGASGVSKRGGVSGDKMPSRHDLPEDAPAMARKAAEVLRLNDMGGWTKAAPELYPHQWSWDSAFIAIGLVHLDTRRAARELETLFAHQWKTGKVPHIVFNQDAPPESYFPGPDHWVCAAASPDAPPAPPYTSCLSQSPVHAIAALRIWEAARSCATPRLPTRPWRSRSITCSRPYRDRGRIEKFWLGK